MHSVGVHIWLHCFRRNTLRRSLAVLVCLAGFTGVGAVAATQAGAANPLVITTTSLSSGEVAAPYSVKLAVMGGTAPYAWSVSSGSLPAGMSLNASGTISGTPKTASTTTIGMSVVDADGSVAQVSMQLTIGTGVSITSTALPPAIVNTAYSASLIAVGGTAPYTWVIPVGPIPGGLLLSPNGTLSGRPGTAIAVSLTFKVTDALGSTATRVIQFAATNPPPPPQSLAVITSSGLFESLSTTQPSVTSPMSLLADVVGIAATGTPNQFWVALASGDVIDVGGAPNLGSVGTHKGSIVGIAPLNSGQGYYLVSSTGEVFGFGSAHRRSAKSARHIKGTAAGIAVTPNDRGYWVVNTNGRIYSFGAAKKYRSVAARHSPIASVVGSANREGILLLRADGKLSLRGGAKRFAQSGGGLTGATSVSITLSPGGRGYWIAGSNGLLTAYGSARILAPTTLPGVVAIAAT